MKQMEPPRIFAVCGLAFVVLAVGSTANTQTCFPPPTGLVSWWDGDGTAQDIVGANDGTLEGDTTFATGWVTSGTGQAFDFDGDDDYIRVGQDSTLDITGDITLAAWIYPRTIGIDDYERVVFKGSGDSDGSVYAYVLGVNGTNTTNSIYFGLWNQGYQTWIADGGGLTTGEWHFIVGVLSGTSMNTYVDGVANVPKLFTGPIDTNQKDLLIGGDDTDTWPGGRDFDGLVDEVVIFNRALSEEEIQAIYEAGSEGKCKVESIMCLGFQPPMASGSVTVRGNRALPLKAQLFDGDGFELTDLDLTASPVIQVVFDSGQPGGPVVNVTDDAYPSGWGTEGNQFEYNRDEGIWQYNLKTKNHSAPGTYTITMVSGDDSEYVIDPTCAAVFLRTE